MRCKRCATLEAELEFHEPSTPHVDFLSQEGFRRKIKLHNIIFVDRAGPGRNKRARVRRSFSNSTRTEQFHDSPYALCSLFFLGVFPACEEAYASLLRLHTEPLGSTSACCCTARSSSRRPGRNKRARDRKSASSFTRTEQFHGSPHAAFFGCVSCLRGSLCQSAAPER